MHIFSSCHDAVQHCLETRTFAIAHLYNYEQTMNIHLHDCYEIYYSISGGRQFLIDNHLYDFVSGDIFFINSFETHHLSSLEQEKHERIVIHIHPDFLNSISTQQTDLSYCFSSRNPHRNKCSLSVSEQKRFMYFIHELSDENQFGQDLLDLSLFIKLMVFLNEIFTKEENTQLQEKKIYSRLYEQFDDILSYINQHLSEDLNIPELANHFHLSSSYLRRIFKAETGTTINKYVIAQRISLAKSLLTEGFSVADTCDKCGFRDYSNFLKTFTKVVGVSPKKYSQFSVK